FERLVEALNPARSLAHHPLFQVMLALQNNAAVALELEGLSARVEPVAGASAKFDLSVSLAEQRTADGGPGGLSGGMEYASGLFERASGEGRAAGGGGGGAGGAAGAAAGGCGGGARGCDWSAGHSVGLGASHAAGGLERDGACAGGCDAAAAVCGAGGEDAGRGCGRVWG